MRSIAQALLTAHFRGHATVAQGPAWPLHWAYDASAQAYIYDPGRAAASLDKALTTRSAQVTTASTDSQVCLPDTRELPTVGTACADGSARSRGDRRGYGVGSGARSTIFNQATRCRGFRRRLMEMISGISVSRPFSFWHSSGLHSFSGYRNPSVDAALEDIQRAAGESEYREAFRSLSAGDLRRPASDLPRMGRNSARGQSAL